MAEVRRLIELDELLRNGAGRMVRVVRTRQLERWRSTVNPEETAWWWWLERVVMDHPLNESGLGEELHGGKLGDAEQSFLKAIALDADNADAHYNLGSLYDHLEQPDKAKKEYLIAIAGNVPDAYNNLARLYLQEKKYPQAALLIQAMSKQEKLESMTSGRSSTIEAQTRYSLAKNLGWVRLEQKREEEAQE